MSDCRFGVSPVNYPDPDPFTIRPGCSYPSIYKDFIDESSTRNEFLTQLLNYTHTDLAVKDREIHSFYRSDRD